MSNKDQNESFSDESFWEKVKVFAKSAGQEVIYNALILYYAFPKASPRSKTIITGALAYFISPIDVIPDPIAVIGYSDDIAILLAAVGAVAMEITPEDKDKAQSKLKDWFA